MDTFEPSTTTWQSARTESGETLEELSRKSPVLVVFLRHCACTFAREALADIAAKRQAISELGTTVVVVHMQTEAEAQTLFARYGLEDVLRISDPKQEVYQAFEVARGTMWQVMGPQNWFRAITAIAKGNFFTVPNTDVYQLPGAFLIHQGKIVNAFHAKNSSDRPDYLQLAHTNV